MEEKFLDIINARMAQLDSVIKILRDYNRAMTITASMMNQLQSICVEFDLSSKITRKNFYEVVGLLLSKLRREADRLVDMAYGKAEEKSPGRKPKDLGDTSKMPRSIE